MPEALNDLFKTPSQVSSGEFVKFSDLDGCLVVLRAMQAEEETQMFDNGEGTYIPAQVLVVEGANELSGSWHDLWVFPVAVRGQLRRAYPSPVAGMIGHGDAQKGKSAPWLILEPDEKQSAACREAFVKVEAGF